MANVVTIFGDLNRLMKLTPNITYDNLMIILHVSRMTVLLMVKNQSNFSDRFMQKANWTGDELTKNFCWFARRETVA